ncbi:hypothetical protein SDRG_02201 [Saprolegnia diclina VS20]|uniref:SGNH hydrolase-type esterase domain-containing protein n=1 Tax=Saprolegnia diclina (strain VS20) TaxID=1156394 RepID=T0QQ88_SAPDV|nr:hypothetical protein SDRG_02201 [Saprolegnia diclina VS20]EQC40299.1 hypothetical protein SDRG_02201 [Saprolegnia diclina VS20]|eukprot:XP_008605998.1 hypothetical protein SDRG_02201 [Saprolegnia diclina VS20]
MENSMLIVEFTASMRFRCFLLALLLALVAAVEKMPGEYEPINGPTPLIITMGDSITEVGANPALMGYQVMLTNTYQRKADVVNRGMSARTTRWWLSQLPRVLKDWENKHPSLISIYLGVNDASLINGTDAALHVPLDEFKANLNAMVGSFSQAFPNCKILLITPSAVDESTAWSVGRSNAEASKYAKMTKRMGGFLELPVVDAFTPTYNDLTLFYDGLHLNARGNILLHGLILDTIRKNFPDLNPDTMGWAF